MSMELAQLKEAMAWNAKYGFIRHMPLVTATGEEYQGAFVGQPQPLTLGVEQKFRVTYQPEQGVEIPLVTKRPNAFNPDLQPGETAASRYEQLWQLSQDIGLPVPQQLYLLSDDVVAFPDLTADGSVFVGKAAAAEIAAGTQPRMAALLQTIDQQHVITQAHQFAELATNQQVRLPHDGAFDLLLQPSGTWQLMILEFGAMWFGPEAVSNAVLYPNLAAENTRNVNRFLIDMETVFAACRH